MESSVCCSMAEIPQRPLSSCSTCRCFGQKSRPRNRHSYNWETHYSQAKRTKTPFEGNVFLKHAQCVALVANVTSNCRLWELMRHNMSEKSLRLIPKQRLLPWLARTFHYATLWSVTKRFLIPSHPRILKSKYNITEVAANRTLNFFHLEPSSLSKLPCL